MSAYIEFILNNKRYSVAPILMRLTTEEIEITGLKIPAGTEIHVNFLNLKYFKTRLKF